MKDTFRHLAGPLLVLGTLVAALWLLHGELRQYHLRDVLLSAERIPASAICAAIGLTALNYVVLSGYDLLGMWYLRHPMSWRRILLASFLGYAVGNNFGTLLGGSTIRLRLYTSWGLSAVDIIKLVLVLSVTFWIGLFALSGVVFLIDPLTIPSRFHLPFRTTVPLGILLGGVAMGYVLFCAVRRRPIKIRQWEFTPPPVTLSLFQYVVASLDLMIASATLYVLMPSTLGVSYFHFLAAYLLALVVALLTQVPGGLGILELVLLLTLHPSEPQRVVGAMLAYRVIYYLAPLILGLLILGGNEVLIHQLHIRRAATRLGRWSTAIAPRLLSLSVFVAGVVLLFSGATPAELGRLRILRRFLPLPVIEVSHMLGSVVGILLILLARSLQRRIETAFYVTAALLAGGILFSLLKGFDYEEALILGAMLAVFLPCRRHFYRKGALFTERFSPGWFAAVGLVLACLTWLMMFAYKHVEYSNELWWRFAFNGNAPRSLRALAAVVLTTLVYATIRLMRSKPVLPALPSEADLERVRKLVAASRTADAHLALLGDKRFLFHPSGKGFIMYGIEGRSWVSMGDPVAGDDVARDLAWQFYELCDQGGRWPVFYQVDEDRVPMYVEMGLTLIKIGEEARVPLATFGLEGGSRRNLRRTYKQVLETGCTVEFIEPYFGDDVLQDLKRISDDWLSTKNVAEKGFSLGSFRPDYVRQTPVAAVWHAGQRVAFANLWKGADYEELSIDLMRYATSAPENVMEFLIIQLMLWGKEQGYRWFTLGMAPLSGVEAQPLSPLWNRVAALAYRHGERVYNFQGLRAYKEKFHPVWEPRYLASPGGLALPVILTNVSTLIAGGLVELVKR